MRLVSLTLALKARTGFKEHSDFHRGCVGMYSFRAFSAQFILSVGTWGVAPDCYIARPWRLPSPRSSLAVLALTYLRAIVLLSQSGCSIQLSKKVRARHTVRNPSEHQHPYRE